MLPVIPGFNSITSMALYSGFHWVLAERSVKVEKVFSSDSFMIILEV